MYTFCLFLNLACACLFFSRILLSLSSSAFLDSRETMGWEEDLLRLMQGLSEPDAEASTCADSDDMSSPIRSATTSPISLSSSTGMSRDSMYCMNSSFAPASSSPSSSNATPSIGAFWPAIRERRSYVRIESVSLQHVLHAAEELATVHVIVDSWPCIRISNTIATLYDEQHVQ